MNYSAILLCAGSGKRTGLSYNKMFYQIEDKTVYQKMISMFINDQRCTQIIVVCKDEERESFRSLNNDQRIIFVSGGKERQNSVFNGLQETVNDYVLIHDGARCFLKKKVIDDILECSAGKCSCAVRNLFCSNNGSCRLKPSDSLHEVACCTRKLGQKPSV